MKSPKITVIIPTYHDWDRLQLCMDALSVQKLPASDFEVVVSNNDPADPVPADFRPTSNTQIINAAQPGSYAARNAALAVAKGTLIAFTDSDCIPSPDWLSNGLAYMETHPDVGVIAGAIHVFAKTDKPTPVEICDRIFFLRQDNYAAAGYGATANVITRRSVFDKVGPFDGNLMSGGDKEWTVRAVQSGEKLVYGPDISIRHPARNKLSSMLSKSRRIAGGVVAKKRVAGRKFVLPQFDRLLPPMRAAKKIIRSGDVGFWDGLGAWLVFYALRITILAEQIRLAFPTTKFKR